MAQKVANWPGLDVLFPDPASVPSPRGGGGDSAGVPVVRGPYVVEHTDIPVNGNIMDLFTPVVGDIITRIFVDWQTVIQWNTHDPNPQLYLGQNVTPGFPGNTLAIGDAGTIGVSQVNGLDLLVQDFSNPSHRNGSGALVTATAHVVKTADPIQIGFRNDGGFTMTQGHVEIYFEIVRPVAP